MTGDFDSEPVQITHPIAGITVITLNRAHCRNAVDARTARKLYATIISYEEDESAKVAILNGANGTFCAGYDLHTIGKPSNEDDVIQPPNSDGDVRSQGPMGPSRLQIKKPVICAVSGYAVAGGLELSLLGDIRVVEEDAVFGVYCRRWGVPLIDGGTVRLQRVVGLGRALDMILTGRSIGAEEALSMGLANRIVPKGKALDEAMTIARQLLQFPQACMIADRKSCYHACYDAGSFGEAMRFEFEGGQHAVKEEGVAGASRFREGAGRGGSYSKL